ncbi:MAG TPA: potassium transporter Kup [Thermoanaerobaculia bacterium]|nr:potassium transporter Kup [Thermoanaerobaculia bacterium]
MQDAPAEKPRGRYLFVLSIGALGVVYGDIGTSPLYALKECFGPHGVAVTQANVLGILSLILWSLVTIISIKYLVFVLRADNRGEGGILALMSLVHANRRKRRWLITGMGLFGAALLYGDGMIAPAITVLSAIEGLEFATPLFAPYVIPLTIGVLILLFWIQSRGTAKVGAIFGPVMVVWFTTLGTLGLVQIVQEPYVMTAINPIYAIRFFALNGWLGFLVLGSVFLVVTGGESLYMDMGHFGRTPIRIAWFVMVLPGLLLNYFGQGAMLLGDPLKAANPFYNLAPSWGVYPLVALSTIAASVASQAVISGAFSLTRQAMQLGYMPRMEVAHTSAREIGQIYVPALNWALMFACIGLVIGFGSASNLAAAYGVAVSTTMVITTLILFVVAREVWKWPTIAAAALTGFFLMFDLAFFSANIIKVPHGGWFPLVAGSLILLLMTTWQKGRSVLTERLKDGALSIDLFLQSVAANPPIRVPGTAVFMYRNPDGVPTALLHNLKHNKVLHEKVVLLTIATEEIPHVPEEERVTYTFAGHGIYRMSIRYGFIEDPDIPAVLNATRIQGLPFNPAQTTYFLGRETLIPRRNSGMQPWRARIFAWMSKNSGSASAFFRLPPNRVVELGAQIEL